jgi:hypothetical protein
MILMAVTLAGILLVASCSNDNSIPSLTLVFPEYGDTLAKGRITLKALAWDNDRIERVDFLVDDSLIGRDSTAVADTYSLVWDALFEHNLSVRTVKARAWDRAHNHTDRWAPVVLVGSGPTDHSGAVTSSTTWTLEASPHVISADVSVENGATLTIDPGVIVYFNPGTRIVCGELQAGAIVADGTPSAPIVFTSTVHPSDSAGYWKSILFYERTLKTVSFSNCTLEYGGADGGGMLFVSCDSVRVRDCVFTHSLSYGLFCGDNGNVAELSGTGFSDCARYPVRIPGALVGTIGTGNDFGDGSRPGIEVGGGFITASTTWPNPGTPYFLSSTVSIGDAGGVPVLTIAPGVTVMCTSGAAIEVGVSEPGGLVADGTAGNILFTSNAATPMPGDWPGIRFASSSLAGCMLKSCRVEYAGQDSIANIQIEDCLPLIRSDSIGYSAGFGVYRGLGQAPSRDTLLFYNAFYGNALGSVGP